MFSPRSSFIQPDAIGKRVAAPLSLSFSPRAFRANFPLCIGVLFLTSFCPLCFFLDLYFAVLKCYFHVLEAELFLFMYLVFFSFFFFCALIFYRSFQASRIDSYWFSPLFHARVYSRTFISKFPPTVCLLIVVSPSVFLFLPGWSFLAYDGFLLKMCSLEPSSYRFCRFNYPVCVNSSIHTIV